MPELPEVETVRAGLERQLRDATIAGVQRMRARLRRPIPVRLDALLAGRRVLAVRRRAKYLLIDTDGPTLLCHLGMTGSWREAAAGDERRHDHLFLRLADGRRLAFHDPRRFGLIDLCRDDGGHDALDGLGPEPLAADFVPDLLGGRRAPIKAVIMDQRVVVGVGNIYASESLFRAGIRPTTPARRLTAERRGRLHACIRTVLAEAIAAGGSSVSDFRHVDGHDGLFQMEFAVYGRAGQPCRSCGAAIRSRPIAGRSTFWCPRCQR